MSNIYNSVYFKEVYIIDKDLVNQKSISIIKGMVGALPYVGTALNEVIFEHRGRVKQERINRFIIELGEYLQSYNKDIDVDYIKEGQFGDVFESIIKRVSLLSSDEKKDRFKRILVNQMNPNNYFDFTETFLDIVSRLNEKEIEILNYYCNNLDNDKGVDSTIFNISKEDYSFYVQDLISKCLLIDDSMNRLNMRPLGMVKITEFGMIFLKFIKEN